MSDEVTRRLFIALPVPPAMAAMAAGLPQSLAVARWVPGPALHITLRFMGDVTGAQEEAAMEALERIRKKPFHVEVRGLAFFDQPGDAVLYAPVESVRNVTDLCARVTDALTPLGFDFGPRPFVPHVTLARMKTMQGVEKYVKNNSRSMACSWEAESFGLYCSEGAAAPGQGYDCRALYSLRP